MQPRTFACTQTEGEGKAYGLGHGTRKGDLVYIYFNWNQSVSKREGYFFC
jgi:hypothetical protein